MPAPVISALSFFVYPVSDMARARRFYAEVLGLRETSHWEDKWVEFEVGASCLALSTMMVGCTPGARGGAAALEVQDFPGMVAHLKAQGVAFLLEPIDTGVCQFARFADPDGNVLVLHRAHALTQGS